MLSTELRTSLTHLKALVSTLRQPDVQWTEEEQQQFLLAVECETDRLSALIIKELLDGQGCLDGKRCRLAEPARPDSG